MFTLLLALHLESFSNYIKRYSWPGKFGVVEIYWKDKLCNGTVFRRAVGSANQLHVCM